MSKGKVFFVKISNVKGGKFFFIVKNYKINIKCVKKLS